MYVCLCTGVTSDQIEEAIRNGARSAADITAATGAGSNCGSCLNTVIAMMVEHEEDALMVETVPATTFGLPILVAA